jgi:alkaline phosphatase D
MFLNRRSLLAATGAALLTRPRLGRAAPVPREGGTQLTRIAFGCCDHPEMAQDIWPAIAATDPDLFLFLGDTVYADDAVTAKVGIIPALTEMYQRLDASSEFQAFRERVAIEATWDDHDYGVHDGGGDFPHKEAARALFLDFFRAPADDPRRSQPDGVYRAIELGPPERRVQILLLDLRYGRSPLLRHAEAERTAKSGFGPYLPNLDPAAAVMGPQQWRWLEQQLRRPAQVRLIGSSVPYAAGHRGYEAWTNFPLERKRLADLIGRTGARGVIFLSGEVHYGEISVLNRGTPYPLYDITSSGLTHSWPLPGPNMNRLPIGTVAQRNFGMIHILWQAPEPEVVMEVRTADGAIGIQHTVALDSLRV